MGGHIPEELALMLRDGFHLRHFVETGTYRCQSCLWAADNFKQVWTIEAYRKRWEMATSAHKDRENITFVFGDSREQLRQVLRQINEPALIWLDAHWCGDAQIAHLSGNECPLREELKAVRDSGVKHFVLIDDARMFVGEPEYPHDPKQWPKFDEVKKLLNGWAIEVWDDIIIAVPPEAHGIVREFLGL